jgi:hypothetical protein
MLLFLSRVAVGQQGTIHTWTGACSICQSSIFNPGWNSDGTGLFMEEIDSGTVFSAAGISGNSGDYEVSLVFGLSGNGSVTINPVTDVTLETNSSPHMVLDALERPDPRIPKADIGVRKQFANKPITFNSAGESGGGFLFFPFDSDASMVTVVVHLGGEVFRFPFASIPSVPGKFGNPEHISTQTSAPPMTGPHPRPPQARFCELRPIRRSPPRPTSQRAEYLEGAQKTYPSRSPMVDKSCQERRNSRRSGSRRIKRNTQVSAFPRPPIPNLLIMFSSSRLLGLRSTEFFRPS